MSNEVQLSEFQVRLVLSALSPGAEVLGGWYMQENRPCPIRVEVRGHGGVCAVVLRISRNRGGVNRECGVFQALGRIGEPVPMVLAGPLMDASDPELFEMSVNTLLPGRTVLSLSSEETQVSELAGDLVVEAIRTLHDLTPAAESDAILSALPRRRLRDDFSEIAGRGGEWVAHPLVEEAVDAISRELETIDLPFVFSNGDYQPANFLTDGTRVTGLLDFEKACFADPLAALARFPVYDLWPLSQPSLMEVALTKLGYSEREFAPRVAVFAIRTLQMKVPRFGGTAKDEEWRVHLQRRLEESLRRM